MLKIAEFSERSKALTEKTQRLFSEAGIPLGSEELKSDEIRLVFAGEYSAGKSSIIKMLTGEENIAIGEGITTQQTREYDWKGIKIIDTPGIHTKLRPDHDAIAYDAFAHADMLVYVITCKLFDEYIGEKFRELAIDRGKAGEMILVINKITDEAESAGDIPPELREAKIDSIKDVITPYTPEQLYLSFLGAKSYLDGVKMMNSDKEMAEWLIERSGCKQFVDTLDRFVKEKSLSSKQTTQLYILEDKISKAIEKLQPKSSDTDIDALEESLLQQRHILFDAESSARDEILGIYSDASGKIRSIGNDAANLIGENCKREVVEEELKKYVEQTNTIIDNCQTEADKILTKRLKDIGERLENMENSEFSKKLKARLVSKIDKLPEGVKKILLEAGPGLQKAGKAVVNNAFKEGAVGGFKLTNFAGGAVHEIVLNVGHAIGVKFKPWEAVKIARGAAIGGQILNFLGVGLAVFMQIKADRDEEKAIEEERKSRQNIRGQFNSEADRLADYAQKYVKERLSQPMESSIAKIDDSIQEIRNSRENKSRLCREMENLQAECRALIHDIHADAVENSSVTAR